jgi:uncharacterized protein (DUF1501 family)
MTRVTRRTVLGWAALAPALPRLLIEPASARGAVHGRHDGKVVIAVRMMGGNDGLNSVIPIHDDRYYRARPTIAIARANAIAMGDVGLHPALAAFHDLMAEGNAGVVQGIGYPKSSRSHLRATEIWETGTVADPAPQTGWLGRYLDVDCHCSERSLTALQLGTSPNRAIATGAHSERAIGSPDLLLRLDAHHRFDRDIDGPNNAQFAQLAQSQRALADTTWQVQRASRGSGRRFAYPQTEFGQALRWAGDMIETECPTQMYALSLGSFENDAPSFDTHIDQLPKHEVLYRELGESLRAFATHLRRAGHFDRVLLLTFSDFGRQLAENKTHGTEHGDASVLFFAGGRVRAGLQGQMPDLARVSDGGLGYTTDFRAVYADVLANWLDTAPRSILGLDIEPFAILRS